jgi:hypothetical protein
MCAAGALLLVLMLMLLLVLLLMLLLLLLMLLLRLRLLLMLLLRLRLLRLRLLILGEVRATVLPAAALLLPPPRAWGSLQGGVRGRTRRCAPFWRKAPFGAATATTRRSPRPR